MESHLGCLGRLPLCRRISVVNLPPSPPPVLPAETLVSDIEPPLCATLYVSEAHPPMEVLTQSRALPRLEDS